MNKTVGLDVLLMPRYQVLDQVFELIITHLNLGHAYIAYIW